MNKKTNRKICPRCKGVGKQGSKVCMLCAGAGHILRFEGTEANTAERKYNG